MRPMQAGGGFSRFFPTGGWAFRLAVGLIVGSLLFALLAKGSPGIAELVPLVPDRVLGSFWLWQPLSYVFVEVSPMGVIFGALILWSIGSALEQTWGSRRVAFFALGVTVLAGVITVLLGLFISGLRGAVFVGGNVMTSSVWVAYGWSFGRRQTNFWGMPITGNMFAGIGILFVVLNAVMGSWIAVIPTAIGILMAFYYVRYGSPTGWMTRLRGFMLQRKLKGRSKHLRVVEKDRNVGGGSDQYLH